MQTKVQTMALAEGKTPLKLPLPLLVRGMEGRACFQQGRVWGG
jgi:hypothetical protein